MDWKYEASIIIPVFNGLEDTRRCLVALSETTHGVTYEVIVVDNASSDGTPEFLGSLGGDLKVIRNASNLGFARACNQGARAAEGRFLVFLHNDTIPLEGWLTALVSLASAREDAAMVGAKLIYPDTGLIQHAGVVFGDIREPYHLYKNLAADHPAVNRVEEFQAVTAACVLVKRKPFFDSGMFDESYVNGYEDIDLCLKIRELGYKVLYTPRSVLYHAEFSTPGRKAHQAQNLELFLGRWRSKIEPDENIYYSKHGHRIIYDRKDPLKFTILVDDSVRTAAMPETGLNVVLVPARGAPSLKVTAEDGAPRLIYATGDPVAEANEDAAAFVAEPNAVIVVLGLGLGYHLGEIARKYPDSRIICVEPVREIYELTLAEGLLPRDERITHIAGETAAYTLRAISRQQMIGGLHPLAVFVLEAEAVAFPSLFGPLLEPLHRTISVRLWDRLRYPKFRDERSRVMVIDSGYFLVREVTHALERLGHEVRGIAIGKGMHGPAVIEAFLCGIVEFMPDFILTVNHLGFDEDGVLTEFLRSIEMPVASWFVDSPSLTVGGFGRNVSPYTTMFIWEKDYASRVSRTGYEHVHYLPLGTDQSVFRPMNLSPKKKKRYGSPTGFVGDSMAGPAEKKMNELRASLRPMAEAVAALASGAERDRSIEELIAEASPEALALEGREYAAFEAAVLWRATMLYRLECVRALNGTGLVIYGDQEGWRKLGIGGMAELRARVGYYEELPVVYNSCEVNFNATSRQMRSAVNQRVFDVPACGGFVLTDHQLALESLFEIGSEIITYRSVTEIPDLIRYYLKHPVERQAIAERGRERVLREHTYAHRLSEILTKMRETFA